MLVIVIKLHESRQVHALSNSKANLNSYVNDFLPLALEFYEHHAQSSDVELANQLVKHMPVYFPNLKGRHFATQPLNLRFYRDQQLKWKTVGTKRVSKKVAAQSCWLE